MKVECSLSQQIGILQRRLSIAQVGDGLGNPVLRTTHVDIDIVQLLQSGPLSLIAEPRVGSDTVGKHVDDSLTLLLTILTEGIGHELLSNEVRELIVHVISRIEFEEIVLGRRFAGIFLE